MTIKLHNTLTGGLEAFQPIQTSEVKMYHCGPTVYDTQHIGNLAMFVFTDILRRTLEYHGFTIKQVINFTDFGHLTSDADEGEDKMSRGLKKEGLSPTLANMSVLGHKYAGIFLDDLAKLNINTHETVFPYASEFVQDQILLIQRLNEKSFVYHTADGLYFDTAKFVGYGKLGGLSQSQNVARITPNAAKKNAQDFVLWKFNSEIGFPSEWGQGFPGWHIECSALIFHILGEQIDIHTGGIEHIPVHHNNEIAQSEAATGKVPFVRYWLHRAHLQIANEKIAKSDGNAIYLSDIKTKGFSPLAFRYFLLNSHYRTSTNFSWESLEASQNAYRKLKEFYHACATTQGEINLPYQTEFKTTLENDLNLPEALAVVWRLVRDESIANADKKTTLLDFDRVLGLDLAHNEYEVKNLPEEVEQLLIDRERARMAGNYAKSDELRERIKNLGFVVEDTINGQTVSKL